MGAASRRHLGRTREHGAYAVAFVVFVVVLLGFMGLAIDSGRLYVSKSELQNAADSCALAAAAALTGGNANQLQQAVAFGQTAGTRNLVGMQETPVQIPESAITFSATLGGTYLPRGAVGNPLQMQYARCTLTESSIETFLIQVINLIPGQSVGLQQVAATAVASNEPARSNCAIPLAVCRHPIDNANDDAYGNYPGEWLSGRNKAGTWDGPDPVTSGAYKWLKLPGYPQNKDLEELLEGSGQCDLNSSSTVDSYQGMTNNLIRAYNTRFGVYHKSTKPGDLAAVPDRSGYAYYPPPPFAGTEDTLPTLPSNVFPDFRDVRRPALAPWQDGSPTDRVPDWIDTNMRDVDDIQAGSHAAGGDRRLVVAPIVDCGLLGSNGKNVPILDWGCILLLHPMSDPNKWNFVEYRGLARNPTSGCVTSGLPGGPAAGGPKVPTLVQ